MKSAKCMIEAHIKQPRFPAGHYLENSFVEGYSYLESVAPNVDSGLRINGWMSDDVSQLPDNYLWQPMAFWCQRFMEWGTDQKIILFGGIDLLVRDRDLMVEIGLDSPPVEAEEQPTNFVSLEQYVDSHIDYIVSHTPDDKGSLLFNVMSVVSDKRLHASLVYWLYLLDWMGASEAFVKSAVPPAERWTDTDEILKLLEC